MLEKKVARSTKEFLFSLTSDSFFYQYKHFRAHKKICSFRNPKSFSEKIFYRMRYPQPIFSILADKVLVRDHIASVVGEKYLVPVFFSCNKVSISTFISLPNTFVMKANHSAGQVKIVRDKGSEDLEQLSRLANEWLNSDFSSICREKHYKGINPQIIFEYALLDDGHSPADYKFNVFNGREGMEPYIFIQHMQDRFGAVTQDLYLEDWSVAPFHRKDQAKSLNPIPRPAQLDEMLEIAKKLAKPFGYMRVDFYLHQGNIYIGELTMTPAAGGYTFEPSVWNDILGEKFNWP